MSIAPWMLTIASASMAWIAAICGIIFKHRQNPDMSGIVDSSLSHHARCLDVYINGLAFSVFSSSHTRLSGHQKILRYQCMSRNCGSHSETSKPLFTASYMLAVVRSRCYNACTTYQQSSNCLCKLKRLVVDDMVQKHYGLYRMIKSPGISVECGSERYYTIFYYYSSRLHLISRSKKTSEPHDERKS